MFWLAGWMVHYLMSSGCSEIHVYLKLEKEGVLQQWVATGCYILLIIIKDPIRSYFLFVGLKNNSSWDRFRRNGVGQKMSLY